MRLNKYIAMSELYSRRKADELICSGRVKVNGKIAQIGMDVTDNDIISIDKEIIKRNRNEIFLAFNKPRGIVCTNEHRAGDVNIYEYINYPHRIFSIGRLDKESEGLLILTNNGIVANDIMKAKNKKEKEYIVSVNKKINDDFIYQMSEGIPILGRKTRKCIVKKIDNKKFSIILTEGMNRQIRRMCEFLGYKVIGLKRIRVKNVELGNLKSGKIRELTFEEIRELKR